MISGTVSLLQTFRGIENVVLVTASRATTAPKSSAKMPARIANALPALGRCWLSAVATRFSPGKSGSGGA